jgi:hypothetical protein
MTSDLFPNEQFIQIDLSTFSCDNQHKHLQALLNPVARKILDQNNFTRAHYFYLHACIVDYSFYIDRFLGFYREALGGRSLNSSEALILDCSLEGNYQVGEVMDRLSAELGAHKHQLIVVSQTRDYLAQNTVFYNQAHYDITTYASQKSIDTSLLAKDGSAKDFICLNNMPRPHRIALVAYLFSKGLQMNNYISFTFNPTGEEAGSARPCSLEDFAKSAKRIYGSFESLISAFLADVQPSGLAVPEPTDRGNNVADSAGTPWNAYAASRFSIVSESSFFDGISMRDARVTEKVFKSIAAGHPFILAGNAGSLRHLQELGFSTFSPYINEDYDYPGSPDERMLRVCESIDLILSGVKDSIEVTDRLCELASFNRRHMMSGGLQQEVINLYNSTLSNYFGFWRE